MGQLPLTELSRYSEEVQHLGDAVVAAGVDGLERVRLAGQVNARLRSIGDARVNLAVADARRGGSSWAEIGEHLGISRQAAQTRFRRVENAAASERNRDDDGFNDAFEALTNGPVARLSEVPRLTGGDAGVAIIFIHGQIVAVVHARQSALEAKETNKAQADGIRGRLVGIRRQPTKAIQRRIDELFPEMMKVAGGESEQRKASDILVSVGEYRVQTTATGPVAVDLFEYVRGRIEQVE